MNIDKAVLIWGPVSKEGVEYLRFQRRQVIICENRPYLLGLKHNKPLIEEAKLRFTYCTDNTIGHLLYKKAVREAVLFCEKQDGVIKGLSGSLYVWLLARIHHIPVKLLQEGEVDLEGFLDKDAGTLDGKKVVKKGLIGHPAYETIEG